MFLEKPHAVCFCIWWLQVIHYSVWIRRFDQKRSVEIPEKAGIIDGIRYIDHSCNAMMIVQGASLLQYSTLLHYNLVIGIVMLNICLSRSRLVIHPIKPAAISTCDHFLSDKRISYNNMPTSKSVVRCSCYYISF